jgi:hypothetical protein
MAKRTALLLLAGLIIGFQGCVKETYDMTKLSKKREFSPTFAVSAARGEITLADLVEPNDTVVFDQDKLVKIIIREDSIIDFVMEDFYDLNDMVSFTETYTVGEMSIANFSGSTSYTLRNLANTSVPAMALVNGTSMLIPAFTASPGDKDLTPFTNFESATFSQGSIDIIVRNTLPFPISSLTVKVFNTSGHTQVGNDIVITALDPGESGAGFIDLQNLTISNALTVNATVSSTGSGSPVTINLDGSSVSVSVTGRDLKVKSGRVILPLQTISSLDNSDTIDFDPGTDIEITTIKLLSGGLSYTLTDGSPLGAYVEMTLPSSDRSGSPVTETLTVNPNSVTTGTISLANTTIDLGSISTQPYNKVPLDYDIEVSSNNSMVTFSSTDEVSIEFSLLDPDFDYVKGYFGQQNENIDPESIDLELKDVLSHITGTFLVANPIIRLSYSNSFAIPVRITVNATGYRGAESVDLDLDPVDLIYPAAPTERDKQGVFTIDKNNSALPELISLPPERIDFSGSAVMNTLGNTGARDNYIFGDSRFTGSLEVEVPLDFRLSNLQFADTVDNFLQTGSDDDTPVRPEDFKYLRIDFTAENGFPVGIGVAMSLFDSASGTKKATINANSLIEPAPVDAAGKVNGTAESTTKLEFDETFWNAISSADQIIFSFTLNTSTGTPGQTVKIYSDYSFSFSASVVVRPEFKF